MILHLLRALFVLLMAAVGFFFVFSDPNPGSVDNIDVFIWILPGTALAVSLHHRLHRAFDRVAHLAAHSDDKAA